MNGKNDGRCVTYYSMYCFKQRINWWIDNETNDGDWQAHSFDFSCLLTLRALALDSGNLGVLELQKRVCKWANFHVTLRCWILTKQLVILSKTRDKMTSFFNRSTSVGFSILLRRQCRSHYIDPEAPPLAVIRPWLRQVKRFCIAHLYTSLIKLSRVM